MTRNLNPHVGREQHPRRAEPLPAGAGAVPARAEQAAEGRRQQVLRRLRRQGCVTTISITRADYRSALRPPNSNTDPFSVWIHNDFANMALICESA